MTVESQYFAVTAGLLIMNIAFAVAYVLGLGDWIGYRLFQWSERRPRRLDKYHSKPDIEGASR